jgi:hypothetical protein
MMAKKNETTKWMAIVLFDVGSENYYNVTVFAKVEGERDWVDTAPIAEEAVAIVNEELEDEDLTAEDIVDVLLFEQSAIVRGFEGDLVKA